jgi:uncharacterized protein (DUF58 family)
MWKSRAAYFLVLLCVVTFFICFDGYLSLYLLVLSLLLPVVSLAISLPAMLGVRVSFSAGQGETSVPGARKGESIPLGLEVWNATPFSSGRVRAQLTVRNTFTGQRERERFLFTAGPQRQMFQHQLTSQTCGQVVCRVEHLWVCDHLGLFALPVRRPREVTAYFWPTVYPVEPELLESPTPDSEGERYSQKKPGDDPTELFALRDYQEGDRLSRVHWKLSQKLGRTLVKELGLPLSDHLLFLLDLNGDSLEADALLDAFASLSSFLAEGEHAHRVLYWSPDKGQFQCREVTQFQDLLPLWQELLTFGYQLSFPPLSEDVLPGGISHGIYLCHAPQSQPLLVLENKFPSAKLTVIQTSPSQEELPAELRPASLERILLTPGQIPQNLNGLTL